ncbi:S-methylmethionine-dependent homocysteine/selenocysteine methylase [Flavobacterium nitrogenifigens]|uniref:S-methylmethionine-dependent homocysteine/selenocysteine methylase n=2 Tax=Flavobacterium TaxID=237 RepID=A0A7W7IZF9_9FLAO|nr:MULTISPECIES: homocysteine S-methyltransferase family protein [Flavobacterium]MBB4802740.1 S-methylmethionine-dependent homocysteine/selenocysteine methylase [Flavobacterium nitrogenifigens]MBB6387698.1 S-methylmethionine-dependent homocysteine/selenocysteine methylase [Flavobacterium notoginsengisoli]
MNMITTFPTDSDELFITDGGLETTLIFLQGFDLPFFAAFDILKHEKGYEAIKEYYRRYLEIAKKYKTNFILESPTWRANPDWIERIGYFRHQLQELNEKAVALLHDLKAEFENDIKTILISGCIGPRGDGYVPENSMTIEESELYHAEQIKIFSQIPVDLISALTMNYIEEAIGIVKAAEKFNLPVVISFTVETDGKLPTGMHLKEAIEKIDNSVNIPPLYYMINCAHPSHFGNQLNENENWVKRIKGFKANASCKSHAELDESTVLDRGEPTELGKEYKKLKDLFPHFNVFGGCCGTDDEHVSEIVRHLKS